MNILKNADTNSLRKEEHQKVQDAIAETRRLNHIHDLEMKAANAEVKEAQAKMREAQTAYDALNEKRKIEIINHSQEVALLNRKILEGKMVGEKSKPVLEFGYILPETKAYILIWNRGSDAAYNVTGNFIYWSGTILQKYPPLEIKPTTVPPLGRSEEIRFEIGPNSEVSIEATFNTTSGGSYFQRLRAALVNEGKNNWKVAYDLTDLNTNTVEYLVPPGFPFERFSEPDANMIRRWAEMQENSNVSQ
jgi:hypothetical protein